MLDTECLQANSAEVPALGTMKLVATTYLELPRGSLGFWNIETRAKTRFCTEHRVPYKEEREGDAGTPFLSSDLSATQ